MNKRNSLSNPKMNRQFFTNLPPEIIIDILSRLPFRTIMSCKCVCKSWLNLVKTHEFAKLHVTKSVPGLAVYQPDFHSDLYKIFEFEDRLDLERHYRHYIEVAVFMFPHAAGIQASVNGLLLLRERHQPNGLYICNPITRDSIELNCPQESVYSYPQVLTYGFGVSKMTSQYKVVRILHNHMLDGEKHKLPRISKSECQVYTLGTGSWRRIAPGPALDYSASTLDYSGAFLNGNLHWLVCDSNGSPQISCFDLETEHFSTISPPHPVDERLLVGVFALADCLCLCNYLFDDDDEAIIWLMKEYGVEKSWTKAFTIDKIPGFAFCPIKVFRDGDILMELDNSFLIHYSCKTKTIKRLYMCEQLHCNAVLYTPSFLSLNSFGMENVSSF